MEGLYAHASLVKVDFIAEGRVLPLDLAAEHLQGCEVVSRARVVALPGRPVRKVKDVRKAEALLSCADVLEFDDLQLVEGVLGHN